MLLAIDIGNTNIVFALCDAHKTLAQWRIRTDIHRTADEYAVWLFTLMQGAGYHPPLAGDRIRLGEFEGVASASSSSHPPESPQGGIRPPASGGWEQVATPSSITDAIISSVVPDANFALKTFVRQYLQCEPRLIANGEIDVGMPIRIDNPRELGADRIINAFAAWEQFHQACIVIDFGTATTFDVISGKGEYMGGVIAPGINLSLEALQHAAAKLHGIAIAHPAKVVGTNTTAAMQSGIYFGYCGLIEGIVTRIKIERGEPMKVIATGGLAPLYAEATPMIDTVDADLTIRGLRLIHARAG